MKTRFKTWTLSLVAAIAVSACAPAVPVSPAPQVTATLEVIVASPSPTTFTSSVVETPVAATPQPVATSRGPNLEATDPATVVLASGGLQLVEFFRFT